MNLKQRRAVQTLDRRRKFLADRIASYRADGDPSRDKHELSSLNFAIQIIKAADHHGILDALYQTAVER